MGKEVPAVRTPLNIAQWRDLMTRAWTEALGRPPKPGELSVLWAQWAYETGRGASMYNGNFGNIKAYKPAWTGDWMMLDTLERTADGKPYMAREPFRAYASLDEGASSYLGTLRSRFLKAWSYVEAGDAWGFGVALKRLRYYTGDNDKDPNKPETWHYPAALRSLAAEYLRTVGGGSPPAPPTPPKPPPPTPNSGTGGEVGNLLGRLALGWALKELFFRREALA